MTTARYRILAVDDEENVRELLKRRLTRGGHECVTAPNVNAAADVLQKQEIELLLLDTLMPEKSGIEYLPEVTARYPRMAVIMMTAVLDTAVAVEVMREGAHDYLTKPVNLDQLTARITRALDRRDSTLRNLEYQQNLEQLVAERTERVEQQMREVAALNKLLQGHLKKVLATQGAYTRLQNATSEFSVKLEELAREAAIISSEDVNTLAESWELLGEGSDDE